MEKVRQVLLEQVERVGERLRAAGRTGSTVHIKVRFGDFRTITRQTAIKPPTDSDKTLRDAAFTLLSRENICQPVRLIGFGVSGLAHSGNGEPVGEQLLLGDLLPSGLDMRQAALDRAVDRLRQTFGRHALKRGQWRSPSE